MKPHSPPSSKPHPLLCNHQLLKSQDWSLEAIAQFLRDNPFALRGESGGSSGGRGRGGGSSGTAGAAAYAARLIRKSGSLADLRAIITEHGHVLDGRAVAAAVTRVPKVTPPGDAAAAGAERLLDRLVPHLLSEAAQPGGRLGLRDLAGAIWALSKADYRLQGSEQEVLLAALEAALQAAAAAGGAGASASDLSLAAAAAVRAAPRREALWAPLEGLAAAAVRDATERAAAGAADGAGVAPARGGRQPHQHHQHGHRRGGFGGSSALRPQDILPTGPDSLRHAAALRAAEGGAAAAAAAPAAGLAWAHARTGRAPEALVSALSDFLTRTDAAAHLQPGELTMLMRSAAIWAGVDGEAGAASPSVSPSSGGLWPEAVGKLLDAAADTLWQFSKPDLDVFFAAVARLGVTHPPLLAAAAKQLDSDAAAAGAAPGTLSAALSAAARAGSDGGRALLRATVAAMVAAPESFAPADAANSVWAAASMGVDDEAFYAAAVGRLADCAADCGPRELTHALLGACGARDGALRARLVAAAAAPAAARAGEFSARDAAAALRVMARSRGRGELDGLLSGSSGGSELTAAAAALAATVLRQWEAGAAQRAEVEDAAASLAALVGEGHAGCRALSAALGGGDAAAGAGAQQAPPPQQQ